MTALQLAPTLTGITDATATALGVGALVNNTGAGNTAVGEEALTFNTDGTSNTAIGSRIGFRMDQPELLRFAVGVLERLGLRYLVTGSIATTYFGEPRFTNDIDIVVDLNPSKVPRFCSAFPNADFYLDQESVRDAIANRGQFNIIHPASGLKIDVMIPARDAFNASRFARAKRLIYDDDCSVSFASPEDVIIKKLEYFAAGGSDKHLRDITGMLKISGEDIDRDYIHEWAERLGVESVWRQILDRMTGGSQSSD